MWVNRLDDETLVTIFLPDNPIARESVTRYVEAMKSAFVHVAEGRDFAASMGTCMQPQKRPA